MATILIAPHSGDLATRKTPVGQYAYDRKLWAAVATRQDRLGQGSNKGHLKGELRRSKKTIVDFREQIGIYVLYNSVGGPVYVGQAGIGNKRLFGRLKDHRSDHLRDRWTHFSWFGLRGYNETNKKLSAYHKPETVIRKKNRKDALHEIEAVLIATIEPPLNKQGSNWTGSREFRQHVDPLAPKTSEETIGELPHELTLLRKQIDALRAKAKNK